jgi:hypothetical protein
VGGVLKNLLSHWRLHGSRQSLVLADQTMLPLDKVTLNAMAKSVVVPGLQ